MPPAAELDGPSRQATPPCRPLKTAAVYGPRVSTMTTGTSESQERRLADDLSGRRGRGCGAPAGIRGAGRGPRDHDKDDDQRGHKRKRAAGGELEPGQDQPAKNPLDGAAAAWPLWLARVGNDALEHRSGLRGISTDSIGGYGIDGAQQRK